MAKRKREDADDELDIKQRRVHQTLKHSLTKLGHAFKICKGFERQKLGRRRKNAVAKNDEKDVGRIDAEIQAIKVLDTAASAKQHLYKTLQKSKDVCEHPSLPKGVVKPVKALGDPATLNVNARLCKSNQVQDALATVVVDIRQSLGLEVEDTKPAKKHRLRAKDFDQSKASGPAVPTPNGQDRDPAPFRRDREDAQSEDESEDAYAHYQDRLAASSDDDEEVNERNHGPAHNDDTRPFSLISKPQAYNIADDLSISESGSNGQSVSPEPQKAAPTKKSSFIPSLTMGGYISGSDSDVASDIDDSAPKKNRRGQRARQQIWEKKFGGKAKHLQNEKPDRNQGWDPKLGAVDSGGRGRNERAGHRSQRRSSPDYSQGGDGRQPRSRGGGGEVKRERHRDDGGTIHPSWLAAKKAKETKEAPVAFQGKKITFD